MKKIKSFIAVIIALTMITTIFSSCSGGGAANASSDAKIQEEAGNELSFLRSGLDEGNKADPTIKGMLAFEEKYGRDVKFISCGYDEWNQKVMASIAAGAPIDVVNAGTTEYPKFAMKGYSEPVNDYVNLKSDSIDISIMDKLFTYQNKYYNVVPKNCSLPLVIYFNKTLFENDGLPTPYDLYKQGNWNYDNFKQYAMNYTRDTNSDNVTDMWGLSAWYQWVFLGGSAASVCKISDDGFYELNMKNNQPLVEALELIQSGWNKDKWVGVDGDNIYDSFYRQKNAMLNEFTWAGTSILEAKKKEKFAFEVGVAPFPYGKSNTEKLNYCFSDGFTILSGSDAKYSAGKMIDMILDETVIHGLEVEKNTPKEWVDLYKELRQKPFNSSYYDSAIDSAKDLCGKVGGGENIQKVLEQYEPRYQALIDEANKRPEVEIKHDFKTVNINFADGIDSVVKASDTPSLVISQDGDALKAEMKTAVYNESCPAFKTIPEKCQMYGYKKYIMTFEYKVEDIPNSAITSYEFELGKEGIEGSISYLQPTEEATKGFVSGEAEFEGIPTNAEDMYVQLKGVYANTIWIKNIEIKEAE